MSHRVPLAPDTDRSYHSGIRNQRLTTDEEGLATDICTRMPLIPYKAALRRMPSGLVQLTVHRLVHHTFLIGWRLAARSRDWSNYRRPVEATVGC